MCFPFSFGFDPNSTRVIAKMSDEQAANKFLRDGVEAKRHKQGFVKAPAGPDKPPAGRLGGCKVQRKRRKGHRRGLASPRRSGLEGVNC